MGSPGRLNEPPTSFRSIRGRSSRRGVLPRQLRHCGRQDELGGGLDPRFVLYHDREFHFDMSMARACG